MSVFLYVVIATSVLLSVGVAYFQVKGKFYAKLLVKTLASMLFVFAGIIALSLVEVQQWHYGILSALFLGFVGDIIICTDHFADKKYAELVGLAALAVFLIGHIVYAAVLMTIANAINFLCFIPVLIMPLFMWFLMWKKVINPKKASIPVLIYSAIIGLMFSSAVNLVVQGYQNCEIILAAASLFTLSDGLLSIYYFGKKNKINAFVYVIAYYLAQSLFVLGICL